MNVLNRLSNHYFTKTSLPFWAIIILDSFLIIVSAYISIYLCESAVVLTFSFWRWLDFWVCMLPFFLIGMKVFHTYSGIIRFSSFVDLMKVGFALLVGVICVFIVTLILPVGRPFDRMPNIKEIIVTYVFSLMFLWALRVGVKYLYDAVSKTDSTKSVFIYGTMLGGIGIAKSMRNEHPARYKVKGFLTDDEHIIGRRLLGSKVYGVSDDVVSIMIDEGVRVLFVSPLCNEKFRDNEPLVNALIKAGIKIMMLAEATDWDGKSDLSHSRLHEVEIEDLLPRDQIEVDIPAIGRMLQGKVVLITGAAGSIGSEMVRQIAEFDTKEMILVDQAETPMHDVRLYMAKKHPEVKCETIVGSICNDTQMEMIFREHRPEYVFHAAAYKHVPMMEDNPAMAVQNNIFGTHVIADLAVKYGTKKFVMISTDKAVNPTNVMGCSKRICEIYCQSLNKSITDGNCPIEVRLPNGTVTKPVTQFITTRFGNVLGSNGSVIPLFREQIKKGGPLTVTHPDIIRYFMLIPEACQLVLNAGTMGHGGEIFVFDMGKPVRIADLAQRMIDLSGAKNVEIVYTGLRDGEKLYEEVLSDAESTLPTNHKKIKVAKVREYEYEEALNNEMELYRISLGYDDMAIVKKMKEVVPEYRSQHSKYEVLDQNR